MQNYLNSEATSPADGPDFTRTHKRGGSAFGILSVVLLLIFSAAIVIDRVEAPQVSLNVDPSFYAVVSHELLLGKSLYTDVWDHKPPAIFVVYAAAELAFGYSGKTLIILNIIVSLVILFGVYYAGKGGEGGAIAGLIAVAFWVVLSGDFRLESRDPNTEPFINACMVWAFGLLVNDRKRPFSCGTLFLIGLLFFLGSAFKPVIVVIAFLLAVAYLIFSSEKQRALREVFVIGIVGALGWIALIGFFAVTGRFWVFYETMVSYNRYYSGDLAANLVAPLHGGTEFLMDFMIPLAIAGVIGVILTFLRNRLSAALLVAYMAASWIAIALPGRFSVHYFQLWLPPLVVGGGWAIANLIFSKDVRLKVGGLLAGAVVLGILVFNETTQYKSVAAKNWTPALAVLNSADETAGKINGLLRDDETFFLWGNTPNLYLLTKRRPPAAILFDAHLRESPLFDKLSDRVAGDLAGNRPELLVVETGRPPVPGWIARDYEPIPIFPDTKSYSIYARRDGRLEGQNDRR